MARDQPGAGRGADRRGADAAGGARPGGGGEGGRPLGRRLSPHRRADPPPDLQAALHANPKPATFFATLKGANRYGIINRVLDAKKPEARAKRIAQFVEMLERGEALF